MGDHPGDIIADIDTTDDKADAPPTKDDSTTASQEPPGLLSRLKWALSANGDSDKPVTTRHQNNVNGADTSVNAPRTRRDMIERVIAFDEKRVFDVMIPRADICAVNIDISMDDLLTEFSTAGHSRMPVFRGDLDDPMGMVHIKDLVVLLAKENDKTHPASNDTSSTAIPSSSKTPSLKDILRKVLYVPPSMRVVDLFLRMQAARIHMALVIDEYGGTDGLVTIEDLIEEIVGEINDEHDDEEGPMITENPNGGWDADARLELEELEAIINIRIDEEDVGTIGGLVFALAGRVPLRGEVIRHPAGLEFEVADADARKIRKIRIRPQKILASTKTA